MAVKEKQNRVVEFIKKFWIYILAGVLAIVIGVTLGLMAANRQDETIDVSNKPQQEEPAPDENGGNEEKQEGDNKEQEGEKENEGEGETPASAEPLSFQLPMKQASVIVDYSDTKLVYNPTLDLWQAHFYVDLSSSDLSVYSVLNGIVESVDYDYLTGYVIKIAHDDGFTSVYSSLDENVDVKTGDKVEKGQKIGNASSLAASSSGYGNHLEFTLLKDGKKINILTLR